MAETSVVKGASEKLIRNSFPDTRTRVSLQVRLALVTSPLYTNFLYLPTQMAPEYCRRIKVLLWECTRYNESVTLGLRLFVPRTYERGIARRDLFCRAMSLHVKPPKVGFEKSCSSTLLKFIATNGRKRVFSHTIHLKKFKIKIFIFIFKQK